MKLVPPRSRILLLGAALAFALVIFGCSKEPLSTAPDPSASGPSIAEIRGLAGLEGAIRVQMRHTPLLIKTAGVAGTAVGFAADGQPVVLIYSESAPSAGRFPNFLDGMRVVVEETGRIVAFKGPPGGGGGVSHTGIQTPPIQLGTSGGPALDIANGFCCGGTLGSLVKIGGTQYILSNSHVFAGDVVSGDNNRVSTLGDDIAQPGLIDVGCNADNAQVVADLSSLSTVYPPNSTPNVDASIAQVRSGMVRTDGAILEIGTLSSQTAAAFINQAVKKSGRTTGLTRSKVSGLNATVNVGYSDECAGSSFTKTFTGQIIINNKGTKFLNSGDSGSLMVEDVNTNPRAVGLLYAGSSTIAVANPINEVLAHFGASMVGN